MKKLFIAVFVAGIVSIFSLSASAAPYQVEAGDFIYLTAYNPQVMAGGMTFEVRDENHDRYNSWTTFCMERNQTTNYHQEYLITSLDDGMSALGLGKNNWNQVAWLYESYMQNTLEDFNNSVLSNQSALQYAFWLLTFTEAQKVQYANQYSTYSNLANNYLAQAYEAAVIGNWNNNGSVMLAVNSGQDVLVYSAAPVPEPATMLLLGTGLIGLAGVGRKKFLK